MFGSIKEWIVKRMVKSFSPRFLVGAVASVTAWVGAQLSHYLPTVAPEAVQSFTFGLGEILIGLGGLIIALIIDGKNSKG